MKHFKSMVAMTLVLLLGMVGISQAEPVETAYLDNALAQLTEWIDGLLTLFIAENSNEMGGFVDPGGAPLPPEESSNTEMGGFVDPGGAPLPPE